MSQPLWQAIRETLTREISEGRYPRGGQLPTEAVLATRFAVNRHTVRRALAAMRDEGLVHSRRGAGVFVTARPVAYPLGRRTRFTQPLRAQGKAGHRQILEMETEGAGREEAEHLGLEHGAPVLVLSSLGYIDGVPATHGHSVFPAERLPGLGEALSRHGSITEALAEVGVTDYRRVWTRITATRAGAAIARHLHLTDGAPLIRTRSLNVAMDGVPVELGRTYFCADRVELLVTPEDLS